MQPCEVERTTKCERNTDEATRLQFTTHLERVRIGKERKQVIEDLQLQREVLARRVVLGQVANHLGRVPSKLGVFPGQQGYLASQAVV